jgi:hypothetical protein
MVNKNKKVEKKGNKNKKRRQPFFYFLLKDIGVWFNLLKG